MTPMNETLRFYDDNAADYASETSGRYQQRLVHHFADALEPGARVLELGSGGGHDALALIERGFDVTLVDGSVGLAKEAERRTGKSVRILRFEELDYDEAFDAIWTSASLLHVSSDALPDVMRRVARALVPSGLVFASFKEADQDWHDGRGRFFVAMSADRLRSLAENAGFVVEAIERSQALSYDGKETTWLAMTATKKN
ncbi:MAG: class I SAM-dependent methyltransferase [Pseudomonadota bacterium]